jgi:hypothetical protein
LYHAFDSKAALAFHIEGGDSQDRHSDAARCKSFDGLIGGAAGSTPLALTISAYQIPAAAAQYYARGILTEVVFSTRAPPPAFPV